MTVGVRRFDRTVSQTVANYLQVLILAVQVAKSREYDEDRQ